MVSLYRRISAWENRKFTYRFVIVPETIGSLAYLSRYGDQLQEKLVAGLVLTCLGGPEGTLSYKQTRREDALIDTVVGHIDDCMDREFRIRRFDTGGSDERQYCSPGFNLPVGQFARTVYGEYPAYHNSNDTKEFMGIEPLIESARSIERVLHTLEYGGYYLNQKPYGEPMMSKRDLYSTVNSPKSRSEGEEMDNMYDYEHRDYIQDMMRILSYSDGSHSIAWIANRYDASIEQLSPVIDQLCETSLLEPVEYTPEYDNPFDRPT